jgi:hypothetical protein
MSDRGQEAIRAAGRVTSGSISQLFVSICATIPTRRVLSVAAVMDVAWTILQSPPCGEQPAEIDDIDKARAQEYALLAMVLARTQIKPRSAASPSSAPRARCLAAHVALAQAADNASPDKIQREFFRNRARPAASLHLVASHRPSQRAAAGASGRGCLGARHRLLALWIRRFFADLDSADFFRQTGKVRRLFHGDRDEDIRATA